jgi:hypothetical protein
VGEERSATRRFVVPVTGNRSAASSEEFTTESLDDDTMVVTVQSSSAANWQDVATATGASWVAPVLIDDSDRESYPTGQLTVRFHEAPSAAELKDVEREGGVRVVRRNEFVDTQVVVEPVDPDHLYLPDLRERLEQRDDVASAWLSTKSQYTKA